MRPQPIVNVRRSPLPRYSGAQGERSQQRVILNTGTPDQFHASADPALRVALARAGPSASQPEAYYLAVTAAGNEIIWLPGMRLIVYIASAGGGVTLTSSVLISSGTSAQATAQVGERKWQHILWQEKPRPGDQSLAPLM